MMKYIYATLILCLTLPCAFAQKRSTPVITDDITHFWQAYDKITRSSDSTQQLAILNDLFLSKGTPGLKAIIKARDYTAREYLNAIQQYPLFWQSIRINMLKASVHAKEITRNINKLQKLYPYLRPATVYFTVGAFRSGGTTMDSLVLIGSEISMADQQVETKEIGQTMPALAAYMKTAPLNIIVFTNVHEYVHTQQKTTIVHTLLGQCIMEGTAEFMAELVTGKSSTLPGLAYARTHAERVRDVFAGLMFNTRYGFWLYNNEENEFGNRDMGYAVGHAICQAFYQKAGNKSQAIKEMIQLDYNDEKALLDFVDRSGYFTRPAAQLKQDYENSRPTVVEVLPLKDSSTLVDPSLTRLTIRFSQPMDKRRRGFDLGPLGKDHTLMIKNFIGFAEDGRSATIEVEMQPDKKYQLILSDNFRNTAGVLMRPFLIQFTTAGKP